MSAQLLWLSALVTGLLALFLLGLQVVVGHLRREARLRRKVRERLHPQVVANSGSHHEVNGWRNAESLLIRAGIHLAPMPFLLIVTAAVAGILALVYLRSLIEAVVALVCGVLVLITYGRVRHEQVRRRIFDELPGIVDSALRSLAAGRSVEQSLMTAFSDSSEVFAPLNARLQAAIQQGRDYSQILEDFGRLYDIPAMNQIAIALRTSARYGSSVRPVLQEVSRAIRARQALRREFMAATSETRFTAIVFAIMPPALAVYIMLMNRDFAEVLLETETGNTMIAVAGALQIAGSLFIWKLIRGVGRG